DLIRLQGGDDRRGAGAEGDERHAVRRPMLLLNEAEHQPGGERAGGGDGDFLAFQIVRARDRRIIRHHHGQEERRPRRRRDRDMRHAFRGERHVGAGGDRDIDLAGGDALRQARATLKADDLNVEPFFGAETLALADLKRHEGEIDLRRRADAQLLGRSGKPRREHGREEYETRERAPCRSLHPALPALSFVERNSSAKRDASRTVENTPPGGPPCVKATGDLWQSPSETSALWTPLSLHSSPTR